MARVSAPKKRTAYYHFATATAQMKIRFRFRGKYRRGLSRMFASDKFGVGKGALSGNQFCATRLDLANTGGKESPTRWPDLRGRLQWT
mmetsp:Transcript_47661/g.97406  ORF Transcript_47661/g.97406 Transcript_47661/m.97406 type:complete len:88 (+) Transcript_47661:647-910(+)